MHKIIEKEQEQHQNKDNELLWETADAVSNL